MESSSYRPDHLRTPHHQSQPRQHSQPPTKFEHILNNRLSDQQAVRTRTNERISREVDYEGDGYPEAEVGDLERNQSSAYPNPRHPQIAGHSVDRNSQGHHIHRQHPKSRIRPGRSRSRNVRPEAKYRPAHDQDGGSGYRRNPDLSSNVRDPPLRDQQRRNEHYENSNLPQDIGNLPQDPRDSGWRFAHAHDARGSINFDHSARDRDLEAGYVQEDVEYQERQQSPQRSWSPGAVQQAGPPRHSEVYHVPQPASTAQLPQNPRLVTPTPSNLPKVLPSQPPIQEPAPAFPQPPIARHITKLNSPASHPSQRPPSITPSPSPPILSFPVPSTGKSTNLHEITHIICPILFFLFFSIFITVSIIYSLSLHRVLPRRFLEGMGILMGIVLVGWLGTILGVKIKRVRGEKRAIKRGLDRLSREYVGQASVPGVKGYEVGWRGKVKRARTGTKKKAKAARNAIAGFGAARFFKNPGESFASMRRQREQANDVEAGSASLREYITPKEMSDAAAAERRVRGRDPPDGMGAEIYVGVEVLPSLVALSIPISVHLPESPRDNDEDLPVRIQNQSQNTKRKPPPRDLGAAWNRQSESPPPSPSTQSKRTQLRKWKRRAHFRAEQQYKRVSATLGSGHAIVVGGPKQALKEMKNIWEARREMGVPTVVRTRQRFGVDVQNQSQIPLVTRDRSKKRERRTPAHNTGLAKTSLRPLILQQSLSPPKTVHLTHCPHHQSLTSEIESPPIEQYERPLLLPSHQIPSSAFDSPELIQSPPSSPNTERIRTELRQREQDIRMTSRRASNSPPSISEPDPNYGVPAQDLRRVQKVCETECEMELRKKASNRELEVVYGEERFSLSDGDEEDEEEDGSSSSKRYQRQSTWSGFSDPYEEPRPLTAVFMSDDHEHQDTSKFDTGMLNFNRESNQGNLRKDSVTLPTALPIPCPSSASSQLHRNFSKKSAADSGYGSSNHQCDTVSLKVFGDLDVSEVDVSPIETNWEEKRPKLFKPRITNIELEKKMHDLVEFVKTCEARGEVGEEALKRGAEEIGWDIEKDAMEIRRWAERNLVSQF